MSKQKNERFAKLLFESLEAYENGADPKLVLDIVRNAVDKVYREFEDLREKEEITQKIPIPIR